MSYRRARENQAVLYDRESFSSPNEDEDAADEDVEGGEGGDEEDDP